MTIFPALLLLISASCTSCNPDDGGPDAVVINCNDPHAENYVSGSTSNRDCIYQSTNTLPTLIASLSSLVSETSGLGKHENNFITHNDKGNESEIFILSSGTGSIIRKVSVANAINTDWEDLAQSPTHLYIADTGNNKSTRTNFGIYRIPWTNFNIDNNGIATPDALIGFTIPAPPASGLTDNDIDCEALIYQNDFLYIFSKNRLDRKSYLYKIPAEPGQYVAEYSSFNSQGLITGADISDDGSTVALIGYNKDGNSFIWKLTEFTGDDFCSGKKSRTVLGPYAAIGQTEAVLFENISTLRITSEGSKGVSAKFYRLENF
jgi:hypothetical protein